MSLAFVSRQYKPITISLDLTTARANVSQGLLKKINNLTIISLGGGSLSYRLNANTNDLIPASNGQKVEGIPITEIYWTNSAQAGLTATMFAAWIDEID